MNLKRLKREKVRFASNSMENEKDNDDKDIPKEWTAGNTRIEPGQDDMENAHVPPAQNDEEDGDQDYEPENEDARNILSQEPVIMEMPADGIEP